MWIRKSILILALAAPFLFLAGTAAAQTIIEGNVYNQRSLRPMSGARIEVVDFLRFGPALFDTSDAHGFFTVDVDLGVGRTVALVVSCFDEEGRRIRVQTQSLRLREGVMQRSLYIPAPRRMRHCWGPPVPDPRG